MKTILFVPGPIVSPNALTLPVTAPGIDAVVSAQIIRPAAGLEDHPAAGVILGVTDHAMAGVATGLGDHPAADVILGVIDHAAADFATAYGVHTDDIVVDAILNHPVHAHTLVVQAVAVVEAFGASGVGTADIESLTGQTIAGAGATGIQDSAAVQAHADGANPVTHGGALALAHAAGALLAHVAGAALAHVAGADLAHTSITPVVAAVPTRISTRTFSLSVDTLTGDLVSLVYLEVGERMAVS